MGAIYPFEFQLGRAYKQHRCQNVAFTIENIIPLVLSTELGQINWVT